MNKKNFDAIVIGGGYTGCSAAYFLTKAGMNVALIEMNSICSGASGRNGGQVIQLEGREELTKEKIIKRNSITCLNKRLLESLNDELECDIEFIKNGSLDVAFSEEESDIIKKVMEIQYETGDEGVEFISPERIKDICPAYGDNFKGAKLRYDDGSVNPFKMAHGFAFAAQRKGMKIYTYTKVLSIIFNGSKAVGVKTDKGDFFAEKAIINATNAWSKLLIEEYPIVPCKILGFVTEQLPVIPIQSVEAYPGDFAIYGSSQKHGNILIGGAPYDFPKDMEDHLSQDVSYLDFLRYGKVFKFTWPNVREVSFIRAWAGAVGFTPDSYPLVGPTKYDNFYINGGFTNGNSWCPICGKLLAEYLVNNGKTSVPIDFLDPERFASHKFEWPKEYNYTVLHNYITKIMG